MEPLILRAAAGDWIKVTLINDFPSDPPQRRSTKDFSFRYGNPFNDLPQSSPIGSEATIGGR